MQEHETTKHAKDMIKEAPITEAWQLVTAATELAHIL